MYLLPILLEAGFGALVQPVIQHLFAEAPGLSNAHDRQLLFLRQAIDFCLAHAQVFGQLMDRPDGWIRFLVRWFFRQWTPLCSERYEKPVKNVCSLIITRNK